MTIHFEGASEKRKELVKVLAEATGCSAEYLGAPAFDYRVGDYIIHRDGSVEMDDLMDSKEIGVTLHALRGQGFIPQDSAWNQPEKAPTPQEMLACMSTPHKDGIALSFPKEGMSAEAVSNVRKLIAAKAPLIKLALEVDELPVEEEEDRLTFPWLPVTAPYELIEATAQLLAAIIKLCKKLRNVNARKRDTDNPRYAFRCFLLRLGFIGDEYKAMRKYLMKGIPGNGAVRYPTIEFDVANGTPDEEKPAEVPVLEKLERTTVEEETAACCIEKTEE